MEEIKQIFNRNIPANALEVAARIKEVCAAALGDKSKLIRKVIAKVSLNVEVSPNTNKQGNQVLLYTKQYPDGMIYFLEEVRDKRKSLSFQTIYKKKNAGNSDGLMN